MDEIDGYALCHGRVMSVMSCSRQTMANMPLEKNPNSEESWLAVSLGHAFCVAFLLLRIVGKWGRTHHIQRFCSVCFAKYYDFDCLKLEKNYSQAMRQRSHLAR